MKVNVGQLDRTVRILVGAAAAVLGYTSEGALSYVGYGVGAVLIATGLIRFCALYSLLGINTCPVERS